RRRTTPSRRSRSATAPTRARDSAVPRRCVAVPSSPCSPVLEPEIPQVLTHPRRGGRASLLPPFALPHLDAIVGPRASHLALETCVLAEVLRNRDPALPIRTVFVCPGEDEPQNVAPAWVSHPRPLAQPIGPRVEVGSRHDPQ